MKLILPLGIILSVFSTLINQDEKMYCFASIVDIEGVSILSEIYEVEKISEQNSLNTFKLINSNSFYKILGESGHVLPLGNKSKGVSNFMILSNSWDEINAKYDEVRSKSNGKIVVLDKESFTILYPNKKEILIRE